MHREQRILISSFVRCRIEVGCAPKTHTRQNPPGCLVPRARSTLLPVEFRLEGVIIKLWTFPDVPVGVERFAALPPKFGSASDH